MKEDPSRKSPSLIILAAVALVSLSVLLLEITFTRILSVILSYHFVYLVVSLALLGLGGGGIFAYLRYRSLLVDALYNFCLQCV